VLGAVVVFCVAGAFFGLPVFFSPFGEVLLRVILVFFVGCVLESKKVSGNLCYVVGGEMGGAYTAAAFLVFRGHHLGLAG